MENSIQKEAIQEIAKLVMAGQKLDVQTLGDGSTTPLAVLDGEIINLSDYRPTGPDRKRVAVKLYSVVSFIEYINEHKSAHTRIFADMHEAPYHMLAAIDYHETGPEGCAEFVTHTAELILQTTDEWDRWQGSNKKGFDQIEFAEFVEENALDIIDPDSATIMEMALSLQSKNEVSWKSAVRLDNGAINLEFKDDAEVTGGRDGSMKIPELFKLSLSVFRGLDVKTVEARFRTRLRSGTITLFYQLVRPHKLIDAMVIDAMDKVKAETSLPVFDGAFEKK